MTGRPEGTAGPPGGLRIATWNVEWFDALFDDAGRLWDDAAVSGRHGVTRRAQGDAVALVLRALNPDAVMVIEAPDQNRQRSTVAALEGFAARYGLRQCRSVAGYANDSQQEIALMFDPLVVQARHDPVGGGPEGFGQKPVARFDQTLSLDLNLDGLSEEVHFSKPPLEVALTCRGHSIRLIGVHLKSKAPYGAHSKAQEIRIAIENRRKQLAQSLWVRQRVLAHLAAGQALIVLGDFNDGPGLDDYEKLFGRSGVEVVLGWDEAKATRLYDPHARLALGSKLGASPVSSRFFIVEEGRYLQALLDYIMVSPDLRALQPVWRIWHPFDDPACFGDAALREALLAASDHFPVSLDLPL